MLFRVVFCLFTLLTAAVAHAETIKGRVVTPDGKPVAARVFYTRGFVQKVTWHETKADDRGYFAIETEEAASLSPSWVALYAPGFGLANGVMQRNAPNLFYLPHERKVGGTLRDQKGHPASGVQLRYFTASAVAMPPSLSAMFTTRTNRRGAWQMSGFSRGAGVMVTIDDPRYTYGYYYFDGERDDSALPGEPVARPAGTLRGKVTDEAGQPVANVRVVPVPQRDSGVLWNGMPGIVESGPDGSYELTKLEVGVYNVTAVTGLQPDYIVFAPGSGSGGPPISSRLPPTIAKAIEGVRVVQGKTTPVPDLVMRKPSFVRGRVLDKATGKPLSYVSIAAWNAAYPRSGQPVRIAVTDGFSGEFEIALLPGAVGLSAWQKYVSEWPSVEVLSKPTVELTLAPGETKTQDLVITLQTTSLSGEVVDENGAPVLDALIMLGPQSYGGQYATMDKGRFRFHQVSQDYQFVKVEGIKGARFEVVEPKQIKLPIPAESALRVVVRRLPTAEMTGKVLTTDGKPIENATVRYRLAVKTPRGRDGWKVLRTTTGADGSFSLSRWLLTQVAALESVEKPGFGFTSGGKVQRQGDSFSITPIIMRKTADSLE